MRLIDADEFCRYTDEHCQDGFADLWKELIRRQPTAFDKEKVIEELNNLKDDLIDCNDLCGECVEIECDQCALEKAIELVEKGGIENGKNN